MPLAGDVSLPSCYLSLLDCYLRNAPSLASPT
jgi:hypothetical protein